MKHKRKQLLSAFVCVALSICLAQQAYAVNFDGKVDYFEWFDYLPTALFPSESMCSITSAFVRCAVQAGQSRVVFAFTAVAPGMQENSPIGAVFLINGRAIGHWQHGSGGGIDASFYDLSGLAYFPEDIANNGCTFEIALGCKNEAALYALRGLELQLFDPLGVLSRPVPFPITVPEPETTTEKTTTTKTPTTAKTTTTKAPTTAKTTTTKAPATANPTTTTTQPVYTPAPQQAQATIPQQQAPAPSGSAKSQQQAPPGTSRTEIYWYTEIYTSAPDITVDINGLPFGSHAPEESSHVQALPTLAIPAQQTLQPASRSTPALYAIGGLLVLFAAALLVYRHKAQKKPANPDE